MSVFYVSDLGVACEGCAEVSFHEALREQLPNYIVNGVARRDDDNELLVRLAANYKLRTDPDAFRYGYWKQASVKRLRDGYVTDVDALSSVFGDDFDIYNYDDGASDANGEYCARCSVICVEPRSPQDVVDDTWPEWGRGLWQALPAGVDHLFFEQVQSELERQDGNHNGRQTFYDESQSDIAEALVATIKIHVMATVGKVETLLEDDGRRFRLQFCGGSYTAGCFSGDIRAARRRWHPDYRKNHPAPESAAKLLTACEAHHAARVERGEVPE